MRSKRMLWVAALALASAYATLERSRDLLATADGLLAETQVGS